MVNGIPIIELVGLGKEFRGRNNVVKALEDINLTIFQGEIFGIIGLSGAGKSTLVRCINLLERPTSGSVIFDGANLGLLTERELLTARQSMGMIFQQFNLLMQRNALQNICFPMEIAGVPGREAKDKAKELLEIVGLSDKAKAYPSQLSGGLKQRVAIARALATDPKVLLCDEATSALDPTTTRSILYTPHAKILEQAKPILEKEGYTLKIVEYADYVQPNLALESGDLDANYFQHQPYLDQFNQENGTHLVSAGIIHYEPIDIYPGKTASFDALTEGAQIAVPNDASNEARALLLLEAQGLITLKEGAGLNATKNDIEDNPKELDIIEIEAAQLARSLKDVDMAVINGNYAIEAGLNVSKDALVFEDRYSLAADTYGNIIAVREGDEDRADIKALVNALQSDDVKKFINDTYDGAVVPKF